MDEVTAQRDFAPRTMDVDRRGFTDDRDRFVHRSDREFGVHDRREGPGQLDAFPLIGLPALKGEPDPVRAGHQILHAVAAGCIGQRLPGLLDQRGTAGFNEDPRHRRTRGIAHHAADRWLAEGRDRDSDHEYEDRKSSHGRRRHHTTREVRMQFRYMLPSR